MRKAILTLATVVSLLAPVSTQAKWIEIVPCQATVQEGESLQDIAVREYGKPEMAQPIAEYNAQIFFDEKAVRYDLTRLYPGLVLDLPDENRPSEPKQCVERLF